MQEKAARPEADGQKLVIVGHGASPKGRGWGARIDQYPVMRLKNPSWQTEDDYGRRVDYMAASTETLPVMLDYKGKPKLYFGQPKRGSWNAVTEASFRSRTDIPLLIPIEVHRRWNAVFRELSELPAGQCPNHSLGMAAITYACEFIKPARILLVGFDNLLEPARMEYHKADRGKWVTFHDFEAENRMLPMIEEAYGTEIRAFD